MTDSQARFRIGVDIGGTFTDFALFDERGSEIAVLKRLTTPADPSIAVIEGTAALLRREDVPMAEIESIAHGTTLVTNAVIERRGAKTGMLVTAGFRDILDMGFEQRYDLFDLRLTWPDSARTKAPAPGGPGAGGSRRAGHRTALDLERTRAAVRDLVETAGVEALAICFLHSYANPRPRGRGGRARARGVPGPARVALGRGLREHARVRALDHGDDERLHPADVRSLHRTARARARRPRLRRAAVGDDVVRGLDSAGHGAALSGAGAGIRPRRRSPHVRPSRTQARVPRPAVLRHGRHHREGRAGARLHRAQAVRSGGRAGPRVQERERTSGEASRHRHDRDRLRRRLARAGRRARPHSGGAEERGGGPRGPPATQRAEPALP